MTFVQLQQAVYGDLGYASTPGSADVITRVKRWINEGHREVLRRFALTGLRMGTLTFQTVVGQPIYALPQAFARIDAIVDPSNQRRLVLMSRDEYRRIDPAETVSGNAYRYALEGMQPVLRQPTATGIWAASDSASDTAPIVTLEGIRANGDEQAQASATLTGTTRVALGSITDYVRVLVANLSAAAVGTVSLYDAASTGNLLARFPIGAQSVQYQCIRLWPTPSQVLTLVVDGEFEIVDLVNDTDVPMLPPDFHDLLQIAARRKEYERTESTLLQRADAEWTLRLSQMSAAVEFPADYRPRSGSARETGAYWNGVGGWYPVDGGGLIGP